MTEESDISYEQWGKRVMAAAQYALEATVSGSLLGLRL